MRSRLLISLLTVSVLGNGCDGVKEQLGLTRHTPDEFAVMQRAPLEIPENLNELPPPVLGAARPQEVPAVKQAQQVVLGAEKPVAQSASKSETFLVNKVASSNANPNIRQQLANDAAEGSNDNRPVVKRLLNLGNDTPTSTIVDPAPEAQRILDAKKAGKPVTGDETPMIEEE